MHPGRQRSGDRKQEKYIFLLMEKFFFLTYFLIGAHPLALPVGQPLRSALPIKPPFIGSGFKVTVFAIKGRKHCALKPPFAPAFT